MQNQADIIRNMASDLALMPAHLAAIIKTAPLRYKIFEIPKKAGGVREVAQPAREVKAIQRWLMQELVRWLPVHDGATAYRQGASIRKNAEAHRHSRYMLKLDFTSFFPSILADDIYAHLERHCSQHLDASARKLIAYVCCWARKRQPPLRLCIGAPSSPLLSNSIMFEFDTRVSSMANEDGIVYTRYADDITLSCRNRGRLDCYVDVVERLLSDIAYPRLTLNQAKTVRASRAGRRIVTGLILTPEGGVSIGRQRKRLIRAMYHRKVLGQLAPDDLLQLEGFLSFADSIEPGFSRRLGHLDDGETS
jgi:RNA-directed DNA polymerase